MSGEENASLKVGAHVLVQLGSELVTDAEQAILECVKNAYDAQSDVCRILVSTTETGSREERGSAKRLARFRAPTATVKVDIVGPDGECLPRDMTEEDVQKLPWISSDTDIVRRLHYSGRVTIEDHGTGLTREQLRSSWLVVSASAKRVETGPKPKVGPMNRTPLGDKGLGRLGSMRLGDILLVESATDAAEPLETAQFRWADCNLARTVDQIPVQLSTQPNEEKFKGTRVSILGLRDMEKWKRSRSGDELRLALTKLISPFEARKTFQVSLGIDAPDQPLAAMTDELLNKAVAKFEYTWFEDDDGAIFLIATAKFRKRLLSPTKRGKAKDKAESALLPDQGKGFGQFLPTYGRTKKFDPVADADGSWYITMTQTVPWTTLIARGEDSVADPGPFKGAIYYFNLDSVGAEELEREVGQPTDKELIREMAGVTILRDGFQVRSQGDWIGLSEGMTSGSTYHLRLNNTVGYFELTGEYNHSLTEKSDREGFVEDAAYRGFMRVAVACREFANDTLEGVRRAFDAYYANLIRDSGEPEPLSTSESVAVVEQAQTRSREVLAIAEEAARSISEEISVLEAVGSLNTADAERAIKLAKTAFDAVDTVRERLSGGADTQFAMMRLKHELELNQEQIAALFESAAVGMSARGLAHELRTHLEEIVSSVSRLENVAKKSGTDAQVMPSLRAIKGACTEIRKAAALIDPLLPRSRTLRQTFSLVSFVRDYVAGRASSFASDQIAFHVVDHGSPQVRTNRSRLTQVVDNLVRNSAFWLVKAHQIGGPARPRAITIDVMPYGFVVSDTGPGVDPRLEDSLFEIFVTAKTHDEPGQGLGLYIIRNLLQAEGCDVELLADRNAEGRRYRFAVNLRQVVVGG